jgi:hypothetical protein
MRLKRLKLADRLLDAGSALVEPNRSLHCPEAEPAVSSHNELLNSMATWIVLSWGDMMMMAPVDRGRLSSWTSAQAGVRSHSIATKVLSGRRANDLCS